MGKRNDKNFLNRQNYHRTIDKRKNFSRKITTANLKIYFFKTKNDSNFVHVQPKIRQAGNRYPLTSLTDMEMLMARVARRGSRQKRAVTGMKKD